MTYEVFLLRRAQRALAGLPPEAYQRVKEALRGLGQEPRPRRCAKLTGREGWRIRVGDYRVIYEISDSDHTVTVLHIDHRRDIYR